MKVPTFGVVTENRICFIDNRAYHELKYKELELPFTEWTSVHQLFELAYNMKLDRLWVLLPQKLQDSLGNEYLQNCENTCKILTHENEDKTGYVKPCFTGKDATFYFSGNIIKEDEYVPNVGIGFLSNQYSDWNIYEDDIAKDVYTAFYYLESLISVPMKYSTGNVGQELIKKKLEKSQYDHLFHLTQDTQLFKQITGANRPFSRPITLEESTKKFIVYIDMNANFLNSSAINLGVREYIDVEYPIFNSKVCGLWNVRIKGTSIFNGKMLPYACRILEDGENEGWLYTPTLKFLYELGTYDIKILRGKIWPYSTQKGYYNGSYSKILESWSNELDNAYYALRQPLEKFKNEKAIDIAKEALKGIYSKALSGLSHDKVYKNNISRQDWYHMIRADASYLIMRKLAQYATIGLYPFLVVTDGFYFCTDMTIEELLLIIPLLTEKKVGHYKIECHLPLEPFREVLLSDVKPQTKLVQIARIRRELGDIK